MLRSNFLFGINQRTCVGLYYYRAVPFKGIDMRVPTVANKTCMFNANTKSSMYKSR